MTKTHKLLGYALVLVAVGVFANLPRTVGISDFAKQAGFPLLYAQWHFGKLEEFNGLALLVDILAIAVVSAGVPLLIRKLT